MSDKTDIKKLLISPDKLALDKKLILRILNAIEKHWKRTNDSRVANLQYSAYMEAIKLSIHTTKEDVLRDVWYSIHLAFNEVMKLNAMYSTKGEMPEIKKLYDIALTKLESGELFEN